MRNMQLKVFTINNINEQQAGCYQRIIIGLLFMFPQTGFSIRKCVNILYEDKHPYAGWENKKTIMKVGVENGEIYTYS